MALADTFEEIVDSLPDDWTDLELDLRIFDEARYVDAATLPGHLQRPALLAARLALAAARRPPLRPRRRGPRRPRRAALLDEAGIEGELAVREVRAGRVEVVQMWGRPESVRAGVPPAAARSSVARVAALVPDLLFGSRVQGSLTAAGHEVVLV